MPTKKQTKRAILCYTAMDLLTLLMKLNLILESNPIFQGVAVEASVREYVKRVDAQEAN